MKNNDLKNFYLALFIVFSLGFCKLTFASEETHTVKGMVCNIISSGVNGKSITKVLLMSDGALYDLPYKAGIDIEIGDEVEILVTKSSSDDDFISVSSVKSVLRPWIKGVRVKIPITDPPDLVFTHEVDKKLETKQVSGTVVHVSFTSSLKERYQEDEIFKLISLDNGKRYRLPPGVGCDISKGDEVVLMVPKKKFEENLSDFILVFDAVIKTKAILGSAYKVKYPVTDPPKFIASKIFAMEDIEEGKIVRGIVVSYLIATGLSDESTSTKPYTVLTLNDGKIYRLPRGIGEEIYYGNEVEFVIGREDTNDPAWDWPDSIPVSEITVLNRVEVEGGRSHVDK